jgi:hypothetical protein
VGGATLASGVSGCLLVQVAVWLGWLAGVSVPCCWLAQVGAWLVARGSCVCVAF